MYIKSKGAKDRKSFTTEEVQSHSPKKILSFYVFKLSKMNLFIIQWNTLRIDSGLV